MEVELGTGWADAVSKILRMGTNNPESNRILSKARKDGDLRQKTNDDNDDGDIDSDNSDQSSDDGHNSVIKSNKISTCSTKRLKPEAQKDALLENELKEAATRGVVHLFNAVKSVNPKSDKKKKKKKKKQKKMKKNRLRA